MKGLNIQIFQAADDKSFPTLYSPGGMIGGSSPLPRTLWERWGGFIMAGGGGIISQFLSNSFSTSGNVNKENIYCNTCHISAFV